MACVVPTSTLSDAWTPLSDALIGFTSRSVDSILSCPASPVDAAKPLPTLIEFIQQTTFGAKISAEILVTSLVYIDRLKKALPAGALGEYGTSHRIFLASLLIASKFLDDKPLTTAKLVEVIGHRWSTQEINRMERAFLNFLQFQLWVDSEEMLAYVTHHAIDLTMER